MKFTLPRHTALAAITAVQQAVPSSHTIDILKNVLIQAADGMVDITGTDMNIQVRHTIPDVHVERPGAITIPAAKFKDSIAALPEGADFLFEVDLEAAEQRVSMRAGRANFRMVTLPASDFATLTEESGQAGFTLEASALMRLFTIGASCAAKGDVRGYLNGAYIHVTDEGILRVVSTDTLRISWADRAGVEGVSRWGGVILSNQTIDVLGRLLRVMPPDDPVTVDAGENRVTFGLGRSTLITKVIAGNYIAYQRVIPKTLAGKLTGDTDLIIGALNRALVMMDAETSAVTLTFEEGYLGFETRSMNAGDLKERVDVEYQGEPRKHNFNGGFLRDLFARIRTEDMVIGIGSEPLCITINETGESDMFSFLAPQHG